MEKHCLDINVLEAARQRISWTFETFPRVCVAFSGGKDSTVMLHLTMDEAIRRGRKVGLMFVDLEGQYRLTIDHIKACYDLYRDHIEPYWIALPLNLRNAVSNYEPQWCCWDPGREEDWIRQPPPEAITDQRFFPFYKFRMEFEDFVPKFNLWYGQGKAVATLVGIRTDESLNRWRTIAGKQKRMIDGRRYTTWMEQNAVNVYPIYDWRTQDIWVYHAKTGRPYNHLYDLMHQAGLTIHQMRICQPYGDDQRKGLWLFHILEPETWARVVARVNGANAGALYANESGNILGNFKISKPQGHTWESFAKLLIESLPGHTKEHYSNKIFLFLKWWADRGYEYGIPDEAPHDEEASRKTPSWRRICKTLLRNDYWCKGLSFSQHKSEAYSRYQKLMRRRREEWGSILGF